LVNGVEQVVGENINNCSSKGDGPWISDKIRQEEQLISEVRQRPPLWNFKLPLVERGVRIKERLWEEISIKLNSILYNFFYIITHYSLILIVHFN
jgi:hypothetical protein